MKENYGFCGIDCAECDILKASQNNDQEKKEFLAKVLSEKFGMPMTANDIECTGCVAGTRNNTPIFGHCQSCAVRQCAAEKTITTCAGCSEYGCQKLTTLWQHRPDKPAKQNLEKLL